MTTPLDHIERLIEKIDSLDPSDPETFFHKASGITSHATALAALETAKASRVSALIDVLATDGVSDMFLSLEERLSLTNEIRELLGFAPRETTPTETGEHDAQA